jgi:hypothetical protein
MTLSKINLFSVKGAHQIAKKSFYNKQNISDKNKWKRIKLAHK